MEYDEHNNKLVAKLVYYGPALGGKTTNLRRLHSDLAPARRGEIMTLETRNDRTLFFDLLPVGFTAPSGLLIKFKLFTVPGQVAHDGTRKAVLSRADGVVFVADSQRSQSAHNDKSFQSLVEGCARVGLDVETLPLVMQYNKRDLPEILTETEIRKHVGAVRWPLIFSNALTGDGVRATLLALLGEVYPSLDRQCRLAERHGVTLDYFLRSVGGDEFPAQPAAGVR